MLSFEKFFDNISSKELVKKGDKLIVGVSGGYDSSVLLDLLAKARDFLSLDIIVAHVNHLHREKAAFDDEAFVKALAEKYNFTFELDRKSMDKLAKDLSLSPEEAGRKIRYDFFYSLASKYSANKIVTGHNQDDLAETILLNILRGSGLKGLIGIEDKKGKIIRPLLSFSREEIESYAKENGLNHVEDSTNFQDIYRRNSLRLKLIPFIEENYNPNFKSALAKLSVLAGESMGIIDDSTRTNYQNIFIKEENGISFFDKLAFSKLDLANKRNLVRFIVEKTRGNLDGFTFEHSREIIDLLDKDTGKEKNILDISFKNSYGNFVVGRFKDFQRQEHIQIEEKISLEEIDNKFVEFGKYRLEFRVISKEDLKNLKKSQKRFYFDYNLLEDFVKIRTRRNGDRISLDKLKGKKKLKDLFIDQKIDKSLREALPILLNNKGEILAVMGLRRSSLAKLSDKTEKILLAEVEEI